MKTTKFTHYNLSPSASDELYLNFGDQRVYITGSSYAGYAEVYAGDSDNQVLGNYTSVAFNFGDGNNRFVLSYSLETTLHLGNGNNQISAFGEVLRIYTGDGKNVLNLSGNNVTVSTGSGDDIVNSSVGNVNIFTGGGNDSISLKYGGIVDAGQGNDSILIKIFPGTDSVFVDGGDGNDVFRYESGLATLKGGQGNDVFYVNDRGIYDGPPDEGFVGTTFILNKAGEGVDQFYGNVLDPIHRIDVREALAATSWNGSMATLSQYIHVTGSKGATTLSVNSTGVSTDPSVDVAVIHQGEHSLSEVLGYLIV